MTVSSVKARVITACCYQMSTTRWSRCNVSRCRCDWPGQRLERQAHKTLLLSLSLPAVFPVSVRVTYEPSLRYCVDAHPMSQVLQEADDVEVAEGDIVADLALGAACRT